jgi:hypothetical protein
MTRGAIMKRTLITLSLFISVTALAGKAEREYKKSDVDPAVKEAETKFKASCGCALQIVLNANTIDTQDNLYQVKHVAESITEGAPKYCSDADSKKAVCQMKTLEIQRGKETTFTFKAGKGTVTHDGQSYMGWDNFTRELDK